jgi:DNA polymerase bacteriophage-type
MTIPRPPVLTAATSPPRIGPKTAGPPPLLRGRVPSLDGAWVDVLRNVRWPTQVLVLDFECFFDAEYSLKKLSTIEYIMDPRFEIIGLGSMWVGGACLLNRAFMSFDVHHRLHWCQQEFGQNLERCTVIVQNARFDCCILAKHFGIYPPHIVDVLNLSRHLDARAKHGLATLCERYSLPAKGDTMQFLGQHADQVDRVAMAAYCENDCEREMDLAAILLPKLTRPEVELPLGVHTLGMFTRPRLGFDFDEADRLIVEMNAELDKAVNATGLDRETLSGDNSFVRALQDLGVTVPMKKGKKKMIPALAKDDAGLKELKASPDPRVRAMIAGRQAMDSWPLHIKRVESMKAQAAANGGMLGNPLNYYGAHTGRWSGSEKINTQNLGSRGTDLRNRIRGVLIAPAGCSLVVADAAQIEARVLAWLAGQHDLVQAFERGDDIYSEFASEVLAQPVRKARKSDPAPVSKILSARRALGKVGILGMGYGMGKSRALEYMQSYPELQDKLDSGEIDLLFCDDVVQLYRRKFPMIPKLWRDVEQAFRITTKYGQTQHTHGLEFRRDGTTTIIELPSGRCLFYAHASVKQGEKGEEIRWHWGKLWGGTLVENIVQSISRDILAEAILRCEDAGIPIGHHIHDELVGVVLVAVAKDRLHILENALKVRPAWAPTLPLDAEGFICSKYGK